MYKIEPTAYGYKLTFGNQILAPEMKKWVEESKKVLATKTGKFGILVDMRTLQPLLEDAQALMQEGQKLYKEKGMERSCVILANPVITMQFQRLAKQTGIYAFERYLDSSKLSNWEAVGIDWLTKGIDPDKKA